MTQLDAGDGGLSARCPRCASVLPADARRCERCGCDLTDLMVELVPAAPVITTRPRRPMRPSRAALVAVAVVVVGVVGVVVATVRIASPGCRPSAEGGRGSAPIVGECTGTVLILHGTGPQVETADLDHGSVRVLDDPHLVGASAGAATTSLSDGYLAVVDAGHAWAVPVRSVGTAGDRDLGPAEEVLDDGGGGWWVVQGGGIHPLPGSVARRVSGDGRGTGASLILGDGVVPVLGLEDGLVVRNGAGAISVVGGPHPRPVRSDLDVRGVVAGHGHSLVVLARDAEGRDGMWTVDVRTGRSRLLGPPGPIGAGVGGAPGVKFSPDGRWLAVLTPLPVRAAVPGSQVSLVEMSSGHVTAVPGGGTASEQPALAWSPDSRRVFFSQAGGPVGRTLGMFRRGGRGTEDLRLFPDPTRDMASVAPLGFSGSVGFGAGPSLAFAVGVKALGLEPPLL